MRKSTRASFMRKSMRASRGVLAHGPEKETQRRKDAEKPILMILSLR